MPLSDRHKILTGMLTPKGLEICRRMGDEQSPVQIANDLGISERKLRLVIRELCEKTRLSPLKLAYFGYCLAREEEAEAEKAERERLGPTRIPANVAGLTEEAIMRGSRARRRFYKQAETA